MQPRKTGGGVSKVSQQSADMLSSWRCSNGYTLCMTTLWQVAVSAKLLERERERERRERERREREERESVCVCVCVYASM